MFYYFLVELLNSITPPNFMVIGLQIGKLHRRKSGSAPLSTALPDSENPGLFGVKDFIQGVLNDQLHAVSELIIFLQNLTAVNSGASHLPCSEFPRTATFCTFPMMLSF